MLQNINNAFFETSERHPCLKIVLKMDVTRLSKGLIYISLKVLKLYESSFVGKFLSGISWYSVRMGEVVIFRSASTNRTKIMYRNIKNLVYNIKYFEEERQKH